MSKLYGVMRVYPNGKHHSLVERVFDDYDTAEDYADYAEDLPDSFSPFTFRVVEILLD